MQEQKKDVHIRGDPELLNKVKEKFPETRGLTYTGLVDWALRYLLKLADAYMEEAS